MKTSLFVLIIVMVFLTSFLPSVSAGEIPECRYGRLDAWFRKEEGVWENSTAYTSLKLGEPFEIKAIVSAKTDLVVMTLRLWETGESNAENSSFEVIEGPSGFYSPLDVFDVGKNTSYTYTWKMRVRPDTDWTSGNAPLNIRTQFNCDWDDDLRIYFTVVNVYILDELWEGYTSENDSGDTYEKNNNNSSGSDVIPGFELSAALITIALAVLWIRKKRIK